MIPTTSPRIIIDTNHVMIVYKPCGIPFHQTTTAPGIMQILRSTVITNNQPLYPVHRLDAHTSGLMLLGKSPEAAGELINLFRSKKVQKYYVALSSRKPKKKMGSIVGGMKKGRRGSWLLEHEVGANPAVTRFISSGISIPLQANNENNTITTENINIQTPTTAQTAAQTQTQSQYRAFLLKPETGKTHQLRVALKSLGAPVLGDVRYAAKADAEIQDRMYLHCCALRCRVFGETIQAVLPPVEGRLFTSNEFGELFDGWFPRGMIDDEDVWFGDNKLLKSSLVSSLTSEVIS